MIMESQRHAMYKNKRVNKIVGMTVFIKYHIMIISSPRITVNAAVAADCELLE